jgi:hypothetical protein
MKHYGKRPRLSGSNPTSANSIVKAIDHGDHFMNDPLEDVNPKSIEQMMYDAEMSEDRLVAAKLSA